MIDFLKLLHRLAQHQVDFVLVGGVAAAAHGCSLSTQDVDVCLDFELPNVLRLKTALADLHPVHRLTPRQIAFEHDSAGLAQFKNLYLRTDWGVLDCLGEILGLGSYGEVVRHSKAIDLTGFSCRILTLEALIAAKLAMGRPRDLETVRQLQTLAVHSQKSPSRTDNGNR
jgi:predicted nucleotidyltransferase